MLHRVIASGGRVLACGICMDARGLTNEDLMEGAARSMMDELAAATEVADKVFVFRGGPMAEAVESLPASYRGWRASRLGRTTDQLERQLLLQLCGPIAGLTVLDAGCGDGEWLAVLAKQGALVTGLDADPVMLVGAARRLSDEGIFGTLAQGDLRALPFQDGSFDIVTAVAVLCLTSEPEVAIRELARVLKPGGRLVLGELGRRSSWAAIRRVRGLMGSHTWRRARFWAPAELRALVVSAGLRVDLVRGSIFYPPIGWIAAVLAALDLWLGRKMTFGAAFLGLRASKPG